MCQVCLSAQGVGGVAPTVMIESAAIAPAHTERRECRMVRMAAMKKVLSPISVAKITKKHPKKACEPMVMKRWELR